MKASKFTDAQKALIVKQTEDGTSGLRAWRSERLLPAQVTMAVSGPKPPSS